MQAFFDFNGKNFSADLSKPLDISLPLQKGTDNPTAWYCGPVTIEPVVNEFFKGSVDLGGSVNFRDISFNPHGHGTHTECVGHIAPGWISVNDHLKDFHSPALLVSLQPQEQGEDRVITLAQFLEKTGNQTLPVSLIIRTLPNDAAKKNRNYSNTNPPYIESALAEHLRKQEVKHLLTDLPSVDRESDNGALAAHHAFWNYPENPRLEATITELVFIPDEIADGLYLLNLQVAPFHNDAAPSRPVLYEVESSR